MTPAQAVSEALYIAHMGEYVEEARADWRANSDLQSFRDEGRANAVIAALPAEAAVVTVESLSEALQAVHRRYATRPGYDEMYDPYYEKQDAHAAALIAAHKEAR